MIKKTMTYENFNGEEVTEDFFFNLTKAELVELEMSEKDGMSSMLEAIVKENDGQKIVAYFKKIILLAYGEKSADGRRFVKNEALREEFSQTEAYSQLFVELATNADSAAKFISGLVPSGMVTPAQIEGAKTQIIEGTPVVQTPDPKNPRTMTREELLAALKEKNAG